MYVDDYDSLSKNDFVDLLVATIPVSPTPFNEFSVVKHIAGYYNYSFLSISYRMKCASGYHGSTCSDTNSTDNIPATTPTVASKTNGKVNPICAFHNSILSYYNCRCPHRIQFLVHLVLWVHYRLIAKWSVVL